MRLLRFILTNKMSILSFLTVGAIAAAINFTSFSFFWRVTQLNYNVAASFAFVLAVIFHFNANRIFTFKSQSVGLDQQLPKYSCMVLINYAVTLLVMHIVVEKIHLSPYLGNIAAIGFTVFSGYLMSHYWVFAKKSTQGELF